MSLHLVSKTCCRKCRQLFDYIQPDDGVLGVGPGGEAPAVVHLVLQRREERLGHGVVVAAAGAAARQAHVVVARPLREEPAGVLSLWNMAFPAT